MMSSDDAKRVMLAMVSCAEAANRSFSDSTIDAFVHLIRDLPVGPVLRAFTDAIGEAKFPSMAEVRARATGTVSEKDEANVLTGRIVESISRFGAYRSKDAFEYIGEVGAEAVRLFGGWTQVCEVTNDQLGTLRAQMRDIIHGVMAKSKAGSLHRPPELPKPHVPAGLTSAANLLAGVLPGRQ